MKKYTNKITGESFIAVNYYLDNEDDYIVEILDEDEFFEFKDVNVDANDTISQ